MTPFSVVALIWRGDEILAVSRKDNHEDLGLPGGKIDPGETPEDAIRREVLEETGLTLTSLEFVFDHLDRVEGEEQRPARCFLAKSWEGALESREGAKVAWVPPGRLLFKSSTFRDYNRALFEHIGVKTTKLDWRQRPDKLWNASCACGATLVGATPNEQAEFELWHFERTQKVRRPKACGLSDVSPLGCQCPACQKIFADLALAEEAQKEVLLAEFRKQVEEAGLDWEETLRRVRR